MSEPKWFVLYYDTDDGEWVADSVPRHETEDKALQAAKEGATDSGFTHLVVKAVKRVGRKESPVVTTEVK